ncbi:MAG: FG-GAP repeat domain-containing protein [Promethearchaeota archaeon]
MKNVGIKKLQHLNHRILMLLVLSCSFSLFSNIGFIGSFWQLDVNHRTFIPAFLSNSNTSTSFKWKTNPDVLFWQSLGETEGYCVAGINSRDGQSNTTDIIVAGTSGYGSLRGVQGYNASVYPGGYYFMSDNDYAVIDMVKYLGSDGNYDVICAARNGFLGTIGVIQRYHVVGTTEVYISPRNEWNFTSGLYAGAPESLCLGEFDGDPQLEVVSIASNGIVYYIGNPDFSGYGVIHNFELNSYYSFKTKNNGVLAIDDLDDSGPGANDLIVAHEENVTAFNMNSSHNILWERPLSHFINTLSIYPDIDGNGKAEVLVGAAGGIILLNGTSGEVIANISSIGNTFRSVEAFNDFNGDGVAEVIAGNSEGVIMLIDVNSTSPTFQQVIREVTFRDNQQIWSITNIGDLDSDGNDEFAIGSRFVGVLRGNNATWLWTHHVNGGYWNSQFSNFYATDICVLDDRDGDGINDIGVSATAEGNNGGGLFIYSGWGRGSYLENDLYGYATISTNCTSDPNTIINYTLYAYQEENLTCTAKVIIDGVEHDMVPDGTTWSRGVKFLYSTTLPAGVHEYSFILSDSNNNTINFSTRSGPQIGGSCDQQEETDEQNPIGIDTSFFILVGLFCAVSIFAVKYWLKNKRRSRTP